MIEKLNLKKFDKVQGTKVETKIFYLWEVKNGTK